MGGVMRKTLFLRAGLCAAILAAGALARPALAGPDLTSFADRVFGLVNQQRAARGLPALTRVSPLDRSAQNYAGRMATEDFFSHISPEGETPAGRMLDAGYSWSGWGENIAAGLDTAEAVMDAWMQSPGHAANILSADYTQIGIGVAVGGTYGIYWVEDFGTPFGPVPGPWVPRLDHLSAATGAAGDLLTLIGADFGSPGSVSFGGAPATIEQWGTSSVSVRVPAAAVGPVVLTNAYGSSNGLGFGANAPEPTPPPPPTSTPAPTPTPPASTPTPPASTPAPPTPPTITPSTPATPGAAPAPPPGPAPTGPASTPAAPPMTVVPATPPPSTPAPPSAPVSTTPPSLPSPVAGTAGMRFDYLQPRRGPSGTTIHLVGTGFGSAAGQVQVQVGEAAVTVLSWSDTEVVFRIDGAQAGRKGLRIMRADGHQSVIIGFRLMN